MGKERVHAEHSSVVLPLAPLVLTASAAVAIMIAPLVSTRPALGRTADVFAVVFLLLLGSVALALAGLNAGTAFGGMGASRAMTIGALADPALLVAVLRPVLAGRDHRLPGIVTATLARPELMASPARVLALAALVIVVVAETGRIPVDDPSTHLELTMIHEAMVLEYAGPELALVHTGRAAALGAAAVDWWRTCSSRGASPGAAGGVHLLLGLAVLAAKTARDRRGDRGRERSSDGQAPAVPRPGDPVRRIRARGPRRGHRGWPCRDRIRLSPGYSAWRPGPCSLCRGW